MTVAVLRARQLSILKKTADWVDHYVRLCHRLVIFDTHDVGQIRVSIDEFRELSAGNGESWAMNRQRLQDLPPVGTHARYQAAHVFLPIEQIDDGIYL